MGPRLFNQFVAALFLGLMAMSVAGPASAQSMFDLEGMFDSDLIQAIRDGDNERVERELFGASPNARSNGGVPAILVAVESRNAGALDLLIAAGARVDNRDREDRSPLSVAARTGQLSIVRTLLNAGADPEYQGQHHETPLLKAARQGHVDVVRLLIEAGAEADTSDLTGRTAYEYARDNRHREVMELLEEHGAY